MWVSKKKIQEIEKRLECLEKTEKDISNFIREESAINRKIEEELKILPRKVTELLLEYGGDK